MVNNKGSLHDLSINSKNLEKKIPFMVYLPNNYSPLYTYPIIIAQDGKDYLQFGRLTKTADALIAKEDIDECLIVLIPYESVALRWENYHPDGKYQESFQRFLIYELIPFLTKNYSIHPMASGRTLMGVSLGATMSLITAINYPYSVGQVIMQSPFVNQKVIEQVLTLQNTDQMSIYHSIGQGETKVKTTWGATEDFLTPNRSLHEYMQNKTFAQYRYQELNGEHTWKSWQPDITKALLALFQKKRCH